jgi:hypothetical protein
VSSDSSYSPDGASYRDSLLSDDGRYEALTAVNEEYYFMGCDVV